MSSFKTERLYLMSDIFLLYKILPRQDFLDYGLKNSTKIEDGDQQTQVFSNPRNAASGILRRTKSINHKTLELRSALRFYAYDVVSASNLIPMGSSAAEIEIALKEAGFLTPQPSTQVYIPFSAGNQKKQFDLLLDYYKSLVSSRDDLDFDIDGVVYKLDSLRLRNICGSSSRTPRWAVAHKFAAQSAVTRLLDIEVQVGRTGALTPVALLEPINIGGVSVSRATLHNFNFARSVLSGKDNRVPRGAKVVVARAGDVIPQVIERVDAVNIVLDNELDQDFICLSPPKVCPACKSPTKYDTEHVSNNNSGQVLRCGGSQMSCC